MNQTTKGFTFTENKLKAIRIISLIALILQIFISINLFLKSHPFYSICNLLPFVILVIFAFRFTKSEKANWFISSAFALYIFRYILQIIDMLSLDLGLGIAIVDLIYIASFASIIVSRIIFKKKPVIYIPIAIILSLILVFHELALRSIYFSNLFYMLPFVLALIGIFEGFANRSSYILPTIIGFFTVTLGILHQIHMIHIYRYFTIWEFVMYIIEIIPIILLYVFIILIASGKKDVSKMKPRSALKFLQDEFIAGNISEEEYKTQRAEIISKL